MKRKVKVVSLVLVACLLFTGCGEKEIESFRNVTWRGLRVAREYVNELIYKATGNEEFIKPVEEDYTSVLAEPVVVESVSYDQYCYQQLDDETKVVYDQMLNTILYYEEKVTVSTKDAQVLKDAYDCIVADYGGLFWVSGYQYNTYTTNDVVTGLEFLPKYTMTLEQRDDYQQLVMDTMYQWLEDLPEDATDYEKALYVYETLIDKVDYNTDASNNQNILSVFLNRSTVCQGYADAAWFMLNELGIKSTIITGKANGEAHAWNLVYLDGAYYFMDVTWGNSKYLNPDNSTEKRINYAYLATTTEELAATHIINMPVEIPECLSTADNYYVHEGLFFESFDVGAVGRTIEKSWDAQEPYCTMKFGNADVFRAVIEYFITDQHITDFCWGLTSVAYIADDTCNVLTLQWQQ